MPTLRELPADSSTPQTISRSDLQVRWVPIQQLKPNSSNARTHADAQVASIAKSISEFGWTNPILVRPDGTVIAGHGRLLAAQKLNWEQVPTIELTDLSEAQCRALALADNQLALNAGWDQQRLRAELDAVRQQEISLELIGFTRKTLARLLAEQAASRGPLNPNAVPAVVEGVTTRPGDLWLMGDHRLLCGDAMSDEAMQTVLDGGEVDMVCHRSAVRGTARARQSTAGRPGW